jgi:hypothetical protein
MHTIKFAATLVALSLCLAACGKPAAEKSIAENDKAPSESETVKAAAEPVTITRTPSPEGARVFFITPGDGDTVTNPITIEFGIAGMSVTKAGDDQPDSGHHHLLIDTDLPDPGLPIPADSNHVHFGDGSTSTRISLEPGTHSLRMLLGDHRHIPHDPPVISEPITITVE